MYSNVCNVYATPWGMLSLHLFLIIWLTATTLHKQMDSLPAKKLSLNSTDLYVVALCMQCITCITWNDYIFKAKDFRRKCWRVKVSRVNDYDHFISIKCNSYRSLWQHHILYVFMYAPLCRSLLLVLLESHEFILREWVLFYNIQNATHWHKCMHAATQLSSTQR